MAKWIAKHEAPEPLEGPVVATVTGGTILWFALFLVQLPFYGWFADRGQLWWVWTCAAGGFLGLIGIWYVRGRDAALARHAAEEAAQAAQAAQAEKSAQADRAAQTPPEPGPQA
ncbi:hypothetical protein Snoj_65340 [Streptomyces nojiriensis]|uniref:DUF2530 domain-containing protein n=1 Tax=Streptomyces nojiriensis TaxID=66374 RepID=A0ABQ3SWY1_9ACTN|nr:DUF2530 domain-containing protein [Streptomyces nojiriensis]QTI46139.1 hypothetical protein JYK04_03950 [Streptomyces nojiriensis]GGR87743.1 hypothetical protein GCM10010205_15220 [Streptomyces nojiriensis]GHI72616.1 hypothetical protein Snoj_65340 [Streptomyces nojiriensis]